LGRPRCERSCRFADRPSNRNEARIESADLTDVQPAEYRADLVVLLFDAKPVLGIVVEAQLSQDEDKRFACPVYAVGLRARMRCPVCLLVVTPQDTVARWASLSIDLGGGNRFSPLVLGRPESRRSPIRAVPTPTRSSPYFPRWRTAAAQIPAKRSKSPSPP